MYCRILPKFKESTQKWVSEGTFQRGLPGTLQTSVVFWADIFTGSGLSLWPTLRERVSPAGLRGSHKPENLQWIAPSSDTEHKLKKHQTAPKGPDGCASPLSWPRSQWIVIHLWPSASLIMHTFANTCPPLGAAWDEMTRNSISMKEKHLSLQLPCR